MARSDIERRQAVYRIWPVSGSTRLTESSCALCGEEVTSDDAWRVTLERTGNVIACQPCAVRSRRRGDLSWLDTRGATAEEAPMADTDEIKQHLVAAYGHLYNPADVYEAGVSDALDRVTQELEHDEGDA